MSNIKLIGNERIEVVDNGQDLTLRLYHIDYNHHAPYVMQIPKEDLSKIINLLLEAQRVFGLAPRIVTKPWTQPIGGSIKTPSDYQYQKLFDNSFTNQSLQMYRDNADGNS